jgi:hypothetical protein
MERRWLIGWWWIALLVVALGSGCGRAGTPTLAQGAADVRTRMTAPAQGDKIGPFRVVHGDGCHPIGKRGTAEGVDALLRNKAIQMGANYVHITKITLPATEGPCPSNLYVVEGVAYRTDAGPGNGEAGLTVLPTTSSKQPSPSTGAHALVDSACPSARAELTPEALRLSGEGCFHRLKNAPGGQERSLSFALRLVSGSGWGVSIGGSQSGAGMQALTLVYDQSGFLSLARYPRTTVENFPGRHVRLGNEWHTFRIVRTSDRLLVWLDGTLLLVYQVKNDSGEMGLWTRGAQIEVRDLSMTNVETAEVAGWTVLPVGWSSADFDGPSAGESVSGREGNGAAGARASRPELDVLRAYYRELNDGTFEATRYFAPQVTRYITMRATTPSAINRYIRTGFPRQFREAEFTMDETSLTQDGPNLFSYREHANYFEVKKNEYQALTTLVRVEFEASGRLISFHQDKVLDRRTARDKAALGPALGGASTGTPAVGRAASSKGASIDPCGGPLGNVLGTDDGFDEVLPRGAAGFTRESVVAVVCQHGLEIFAKYSSSSKQQAVVVFHLGPAGHFSPAEFSESIGNFKGHTGEGNIVLMLSSRSIVSAGVAGDQKKTTEFLFAIRPADLEKKVFAIAKQRGKQ